MLVGYRQWLLIIHLIPFKMLWSLQKQSCSSKASAIYALDIYNILLCWVVRGCTTEFWFLRSIAASARKRETDCSPLSLGSNSLIASFHLSEQLMHGWCFSWIACIWNLFVILLLKNLRSCCIENWQSTLQSAAVATRKSSSSTGPHPKCEICLTL